jgi:hypothetical protein
MGNTQTRPKLHSITLFTPLAVIDTDDSYATSLQLSITVSCTYALEERESSWLSVTPSRVI